LSHDIAPAPVAKDTLAFVASPQAGINATAVADKEGDDVTVLEDTFVAASENGFMLRRGGEVTWTCTAPGAQASLTW